MADLTGIMQAGLKTLSLPEFTRLLDRQFLPLEGIHLMQFTGIKDKNSRDIYEGDIVRTWDRGTQFTVEVKWGQGSAGFFLYRELGGIQLHLSGGGQSYDQETCEVIGNVFENPDILPKVPKT